MNERLSVVSVLIVCSSEKNHYFSLFFLSMVFISGSNVMNNYLVFLAFYMFYIYLMFFKMKFFYLKHPHTIRDPPACLTVGTAYSSLSLTAGFLCTLTFYNQEFKFELICPQYIVPLFQYLVLMLFGP